MLTRPEGCVHHFFETGKEFFLFFKFLDPSIFASDKFYDLIGMMMYK
jgi:hypothetical protein